MARRARKIKTISGLALLAALVVGGSLVISAGQAKTYIDPDHRFAFDLPHGARAKDFHAQDGSSEAIVFSSEGDMQVVITPWQGDFSEDRMRDAYPYLEGLGSTPVMVSGEPGFYFLDPSVNAAEVWFAHAGLLYQITAYDDAIDLVSSFIDGWHFD